ncbi:hypothetical protein [Arthrobacter sp. Soil736]|uniref:hypothetical protein n=1 Tax=Arthrobacter sp. Soil736 TaxID=1736395 RepID=UPI000B2D0985|nr:hypothetical protein [Arthrobacter sp. Soil736]
MLVNNAGNFYAGYFEEVSPEQVRAQLETNVFGLEFAQLVPVSRHEGTDSWEVSE